MEDIKPQRLQSVVTLEEVELKFDQQLHSLLLSHRPVSAQQLGRLSTPYTFLTGRNDFMWLAHSWNQRTHITLRLAGCKAQ